MRNLSNKSLHLLKVRAIIEVPVFQHLKWTNNTKNYIYFDRPNSFYKYSNSFVKNSLYCVTVISLRRSQKFGKTWV